MPWKICLSREKKCNGFKANTNLIMFSFEEFKKRPGWLTENSAPDLCFQQAT